MHTPSELIDAVNKGYSEITWIDNIETPPELRSALETYTTKRREYIKTVFEKVASNSDKETKS